MSYRFNAKSNFAVNSVQIHAQNPRIPLLRIREFRANLKQNFARNFTQISRKIQIYARNFSFLKSQILAQIHAKFFAFFAVVAFFALAPNAHTDDTATQDDVRLIDGVYSTQNTINSSNSQAKTTQSVQNSSKFGIDLGVGYINSSFEGESSLSNQKVKSSRAHGVDIFANFTYKIHLYFGLSFGLDWEFMPIYWDGQGLLNAYNAAESRLNNQPPNSYNSSDFLWSTYLTFGAFSDIWQSKSSSVRLFANFGLGLNYFLGDGRYEGKVKSCSYGWATKCEVEYQMIPFAFSLPVSFGARFGFAKSHGIELVGKIETQDAKFTFKTNSGDIKTTISRNASVALRYVYRFAF